MTGDAPIAYIDRTRAYYAALGYPAPYCWARFDDVPFAPLPRPLSACSIAIVTTAAPFRPGKGDQGPGAAYNAAAKFFRVYQGETAEIPDLRISHVAIDRDHCSGTDIGTYFPLAALRGAERAGRIGGVAPHFFGLPTDRSQRATLGRDCPDLLDRCRRDRIDAAILVPNCPVCHQSVALAARRLEAAGIATVIMGCARDVVERAGVPRFLFSDFPLGHSAGRPDDPESQEQSLNLALDLLAGATGPRTTRTSPLTWPGPPGWKADYANPDRLTPAEIARLRADFDRGRATARALRDGPAPR